jgi:hypothetical protein
VLKKLRTKWKREKAVPSVAKSRTHYAAVMYGLKLAAARQAVPFKSGGPAAWLEVRGRVASGPVSRILSRTIIPLGDALLRRSSDLPGGFPPSRRTGIGTRVSAPGQHASAARVWPSDSLPIWSCSVWGLPCHRLYRRRGALLPHLFTLTPGDEAQGGMFSVALAVFEP